MEGAGAGAGSDVVLAAFLQEVAAAGPGRLESTRLGLRMGPEALAEFHRRLLDLLEEYAARPTDPQGEKWSVYLGMHPEV
jgi:hypothetical protein